MEEKGRKKGEKRYGRKGKRGEAGEKGGKTECLLAKFCVKRGLHINPRCVCEDVSR